MYISRNGISSKYQDKSHRNMRNFQFHSKGLPAIDPRFLDAEKEHLTMGHALPGKQTVVRLNDKQRQYLKKLFDKGTEKNQRKAVPAEVEKQMRHIKSPTGTGLLFKKKTNGCQRIGFTITLVGLQLKSAFA